MVLHSLGSLQHSGCRSLPPPDITFPLATLDLEYEHGGAVHQLHEDEHADAQEAKLQGGPGARS